MFNYISTYYFSPSVEILLLVVLSLYKIAFTKKTERSAFPISPKISKITFTFLSAQNLLQVWFALTHQAPAWFHKIWSQLVSFLFITLKVTFRGMQFLWVRCVVKTKCIFYINCARVWPITFNQNHKRFGTQTTEGYFISLL